MLLLTLPHSLNTLHKLINKSISLSTFPDMWKVAIVRPIPKTANPSELKDLRPVSILPCLSKILEKAVCEQLTRFLEDNNILPQMQSGFRKRRGTVTALADVTDNILMAQDKGMCTFLVLLDFSRAFDSLHLNLLLSKLSFYGFDAGAIDWFESYLTNRYQLVKLSRDDGSIVMSDKVLINRGVPQGSILGPILFILYLADIQEQILHCKYHIYADDVQVYISCNPCDVDSTIDKLNKDLARIATWSNNNCLLLNPDKTKYLIFGSNHQLAKLNTPLNIRIRNQPIERVYEARNLGLCMDSELRFEKHVNDNIRNCFYKLKVLYKMRPFIKEELRIQLVETLVLSKLNYMDIVTGPRLLAKTKKLIQRVQNACARFCFSIPPRAHVTPFLNKHAMLKMMHRRKLHLASLLFGVIKTGTPSYLYDKLSWVSRPGSRQCAKTLANVRHSSAAFRGSFRYAATKCWNNIPPPIKNLNSIHSFRIRLKRFLCDHQIKEEIQRNDTSAI